MNRTNLDGRTPASARIIFAFAAILFTGCFDDPKLSDQLRCNSDDGCLAGWFCDKSIDAGGGLGRCMMPDASADMGTGTSIDALGASDTASSQDVLVAAQEVGHSIDQQGDDAIVTNVAIDSAADTPSDSLSISDVPVPTSDTAVWEVQSDLPVLAIVDSGRDGPATDGSPDTTSSHPDTPTTDGPGQSDTRVGSDAQADARDATDVGDAARDLEAPADVTPPDTTLSGVPPTLTNNATPTFTFASTEPGTFECQVDTAVATTCSSPYTAPALSDGRHVFSVTAIDSAGNRDPSPATFAFTVDVTPPDTDVNGWPLPTTGRYAAFAFTSSDSKAGFECSLDSADVWESCTSPKPYVISSDGAHTFRVRAVDLADNRDPTPASATFTVSLSLAAPFPDSSTIFCTDGTSKVDCPVAGASGWGQDGSYLINRPRYTSSAGTVTDAITGLTWEQGNAPIGTWDTQVERCATLSTNGYTDWRLPSRLEALTVIDAGRVQPALDAAVFATTTTSNYFWLGQEIDGVPSAAWMSDWLDANLSWNGKNAQYSAKCVRGPTLSGTLAASASGLTVYDSRTNLTWQRTVDGLTYTWLSALSYCNALTLDSGTGWRLPSVKELQTLINVGAGLNPPLIPPVFPSGNAVEMWTSSPAPATPSSSYTVNMLNGAGGSQPTSTLLQVRCVR